LKTKEAVTKTQIHPPHRPDLAAFHLYEALKDAIHGKKFGSDDNVNEKAN
jgi:hypothetical protein